MPIAKRPDHPTYSRRAKTELLTHPGAGVFTLALLIAISSLSAPPVEAQLTVEVQPTVENPRAAAPQSPRVAQPGQTPEGPQTPPPTKPKSSGSGESESKLRTGRFFVEIEERTDEETLSPNYAEALVVRMLYLHGLRRTKKRSRAQFIIEGSVDVSYLKPVYFEYENSKVLLEHQFSAEAKLTVETKGSSATEEIRIAKLKHGLPDRTRARDAIRRLIGTQMSVRLVKQSALADREVAKLVFELEGSETTRPFDQVLEEIVKLDVRSVPYLLDLMLADEPVALSGSLEGLTIDNRKRLRLYHLADHALARIFKKSPKTPFPKVDRLEAYKAWNNHWVDERDLPKSLRL